MTARAAVRKAGTNLWQPLDLGRDILGSALGAASSGDDEVNRALEQLLIGGSRFQQVREVWRLNFWARQVYRQSY